MLYHDPKGYPESDACVPWMDGYISAQNDSIIKMI